MKPRRSPGSEREKSAPPAPHDGSVVAPRPKRRRRVEGSRNAPPQERTERAEPTAARAFRAALAAYRERSLPFVTLLVAGANLSLVQFVTLTEMPSLFGSNELVAILVLSAYFLGLSAGYLISDKLRRSHLMALGAATLALHATLPFSARWFAGTLWRINLQGMMPPFVFLLVFFGVTPLYAIFLPRLIDAEEEEDPTAARVPEVDGRVEARGGRLLPLYVTELCGSALGILVAAVLTPARVSLILTLHLAGVVALVILYAGTLRVTLARLLVPVPLLYLALYATLDRASLEYFYKHRKGFSSVELVASELSPYQRVDIFDGLWKTGRSRFLYLNGNLLYGSTALHQHNLLVSILPNLVVGPTSNALVVAGGSLDAARYLAPRVGHLRVVEIDETVARLAREHIQGPRGGLPTGWDLIIDDGKHFLGAWEGAPFDVISIDVPVPSHLQTAALHSERFFALARSRLAPGGIFSISLSGSYAPPDPDAPFPAYLGQRVMAGLLKTFRHVAVFYGDDHAYAWASDTAARCDAGAVRDKAMELVRGNGLGEVFGAPRITLLDDAEARRRAAGFEPIGEADMQIVLRLSMTKLYERFYEPPENR